MEAAKEDAGTAYILDPPAGAGLRHYAAAMLLVAAALGALVFELGQASVSDAALETQDAVMVDLPPVEAGSHPQGDDAPPQQTPQPPEDLAPAKPPAPDARVPPAPAPADMIEQPASRPPQAQASASAPQDAHETGGPTPPRAEQNDADESETRRPSAHLVTLWQKALMGRLQSARHGLAGPHATGIARIAFAIDRDGRLVSARVARGSGSAAVDAAALSLVRRAAPFPSPPAGASAKALSFVVPISFRS